jgi:AraC-like DNA-binding protein
MLRSRNYAASPDLRTVVARHYVFSVDLPDDHLIVDRLLGETAFARLLLRGDWAAEIEPGVWASGGPIPVFGANAGPLRVRVRGGFHIVGIAFRPSGWKCLFDEPAHAIADRMVPLADLWGGTADLLYAQVMRLAPDDDAAIIAAIETAIRRRLGQRGGAADRAMLAFERIARNDSTVRVAHVAERLGISQRQFERLSCAHFGHTPKMVLRRSRFLDMAEAVRGMSRPSEEELAALRYADQSHLNREFRHFIGMTPGQFAATPTPLFTAGLELRRLRKQQDAEEAMGGCCPAADRD